MLFTPYGAFEGYQCDDDARSPMTVLVFFWLYMILTAWVRATTSARERLWGLSLKGRRTLKRGKLVGGVCGPKQKKNDQ